MKKKIPRKQLYDEIDRLHAIVAAFERGATPDEALAAAVPPLPEYEPDIDDLLTVALLHVHEDMKELRAHAGLPPCHPPRWLREGPGWIHPRALDAHPAES